MSLSPRSRLVAFFGLIFLVLPLGVFAQSAGAYPVTGGRVNITQARALLAAEPGTVIVDVRTAAEYNSGYIPGALLLPNTSINARSAGQAIPALDTPVLVYCRSGNRSAQAARSLAALGYSRIYDLGPITAWDGALVRP